MAAMRRRIDELRDLRNDAIRSAMLSGGVAGVFNEQARQLGEEVDALQALLEKSTNGA